MFDCGEIAIFRQRMMIAPPPALTRVKENVNNIQRIGVYTFNFFFFFCWGMYTIFSYFVGSVYETQQNFPPRISLVKTIFLGGGGGTLRCRIFLRGVGPHMGSAENGGGRLHMAPKLCQIGTPPPPSLGCL